jgi:hypothetical protein
MVLKMVATTISPFKNRGLLKPQYHFTTILTTKKPWNIAYYHNISAIFCIFSFKKDEIYGRPYHKENFCKLLIYQKMVALTMTQ